MNHRLIASALLLATCFAVNARANNNSSGIKQYAKNVFRPGPWTPVPD